LPFTEFSYKNSYQASLQMAPFEALYGRKCHTPLNFSETGESQVFGPDIIKDAEEQVQLIRNCLKATQSRQKSYADSRWRPLAFQVGDFFYLRVTTLKGMQHFHVKGKLAPRYIGPYKILECHGEMSYKLELPPKLSEFHDVFHVSQLHKCLQAPNQHETFKEIDQDSIDLNHDLTYRERPIRILEKDVYITLRRKINMYKVQWSNHTEDEATWQREDYLQREFPELLNA
jgi:hypothetical protein